jgi:hypothetical protein
MSMSVSTTSWTAGRSHTTRPQAAASNCPLTVRASRQVWVLRTLRKIQAAADLGLRTVGIDRFLVPQPCLAHGGKSRLFRMV